MPGRQQRSRRVEVILCKRTNLGPTHPTTIATPIHKTRKPQAARGGVKINVIHRAPPAAHQLTFLILTTAVALMLGLEAFFGAFVAGIVVATTEKEASSATLAIRSFSLAFFIPVYFAGIGLGLDLIHSFDVVFFVGFLMAACVTKPPASPRRRGHLLVLEPVRRRAPDQHRRC